MAVADRTEAVANLEANVVAKAGTGNHLRTGAQLPAARAPLCHDRRPPGESTPTRAAGGWRATQTPQRRPVSCSALLGGTLRMVPTVRTPIVVVRPGEVWQMKVQ